MTQEGIELILRAWTEPQPFGWEGRFYRFRTVSVWPRTLQDPHPLVFGSGNSPESIAFAARRRLGLAIAFAPPLIVRRSVELYRRLCAESGWEPSPDHVLYRCLIRIEDTLERARTRSEAAPSIPVGPTPGARGGASERGPIADMRPQLLGGPDEVIEQARALRDCGVGVLDLDFVLIDLWKDLYVPCLERSVPKLAPGAMLVADNMLQPREAREDALAYRRAVRALAGVSSVLLPIGSGLEVSRMPGKDE